ncbi:MAG: hypothetical protein ACN4GW_09935 [Desulforhopalus sp.]
MKQYTENQYDDDLTVGTDDYDYDDSYQTDAVDLFEFSADDESPISQLKSLILSIDWEITDEVLMEFNDELIALRTLWVGEKLNLVYIQALEKISKYIYHKKADSHPNAIKLLLTLYYNLEKIVSSVDLSDEEKKKILFEDVKRFENLKRQIGQTSYDVDAPESNSELGQLQEPAAPAGAPAGIEDDGVGEEEDLLLNLRAIVLGIDWEITDEDLNSLRQEVISLEQQFSDSKPKRILLQGIGTLGAYIKLKKSDAHADAFKVLHDIYDSLEQIVQTPMSLEEEKKILFPAVESFNAFKALVGPTITEEPEADEGSLDEGNDFSGATEPLAPAFADISDEEMHGFQADEEARSLGLDESGNVGSHVDSFFGVDEDDSSQPSEGDDYNLQEGREDIKSALGIESEEDSLSVEKDAALQGVDVEEDDEDDEPSTHYEDLAPALSDAFDNEGGVASLSSLDTLPADDTKSEPVTSSLVEEGEELNLELDLAGEAQPAEAGFAHLDREIALQGVDVETEADDDSDEESLPTMGGELAPALAENEERSAYSAEDVESFTQDAEIEEEILQNIDGLFGEESVETAALAETLTPAADEESSNLVEREDEDIDLQVDSFFSVEDNGEEDRLSVSPKEMGAVPVSGPFMESATEQEVVFELVDVDGGDFDPELREALHTLRTRVQSLENEFDNEVLMAVFQQLTILRQGFEEKPLEQTFIRLLSTVIQHIDRYRQSTAEDTFKVLSEVCDGLEQGQNDSVKGKQGRLLSATTLVLDWQQEQLAG